MKTPFQIAERYIQLRKQYAPKFWGDLIILINSMIVTPLITIFLLLTHNTSFLSVLSAASGALQSWRGWIEYNDLRFEVQRMYLRTMQVGGPFITTNDTNYMPYVFADAVMRST
jgi:hypothetical protein